MHEIFVKIRLDFRLNYELNILIKIKDSRFLTQLG